METILTIKNCHRAKTVRPVNNPEAPEHEFGWRKKRYEQGMFSCRFNHIITAPDGSEIEVSDLNLKRMGCDLVEIRGKYGAFVECRSERVFTIPATPRKKGPRRLSANLKKNFRTTSPIFRPTKRKHTQNATQNGCRFCSPNTHALRVQ